PLSARRAVAVRADRAAPYRSGPRAVVGCPGRGHGLGDPTAPAASGVLAADRTVPRLADDAVEDLDRQSRHLERGGHGGRDGLAWCRTLLAHQAQPVPVRLLRGPPALLLDRTRGLRRALRA